MLPTLTLLLLISSLSSAWPDGAPTLACTNLTPHHGARPQTGPSPYVLKVRKETAYTYRVELEGYGPQDWFRGFILQSRTGGGYFTFKEGQTMSCSVDFDTITHRDSADKNLVSALWTTFERVRDEDQHYLVSFEATVVRTKSIFWTGIKSGGRARYVNNWLITPLVVIAMLMVLQGRTSRV